MPKTKENTESLQVRYLGDILVSKVAPVRKWLRRIKLHSVQHMKPNTDQASQSMKDTKLTCSCRNSYCHDSSSKMVRVVSQSLLSKIFSTG